jgi:hypothetical protein
MSGETRRGQFYLDPNGVELPRTPPPPPVYPTPRPGYGTIFVTQDRDGTWSALWQDEGNSGFADCEGDRDTVIAWAKAQPAAERIIEDGALSGNYIPLE